MFSRSKPASNITCPVCRNNISIPSGQISNGDQLRLLQQIADLELENRQLRQSIEDLQTNINYLQHQDEKVNNDTEPNLDELTFRVGKTRIKASRLERHGPFFVNDKGKAHLGSCIYGSPKTYSRNKKVTILDLGDYKLARCCCSPEALDLLEDGNLRGLEEFQKNIGKGSRDGNCWDD